MFSHFYHGSLRTLLTVFGELFSGIVIARSDQNGRINTVIPIPIRSQFGDRFLLQSQEKNQLSTDDFDKQFMTTYPRMSYGIVDFQQNLDKSRSLHNYYIKETSNPDESSFIKTPAVYDIKLDLRILSKNSSDAFQIIEQILPWFRPSLTVQVHNEVIERDYTYKFSLIGGPIIEDSFEGDPSASKREVEIILSFETTIEFYGPANTNYENAVQKFIGSNSIPLSNNTRIDQSMHPFIAKVHISKINEDNEILETTETSYLPPTARTHEDITSITTEKIV